LYKLKIYSSIAIMLTALILVTSIPVQPVSAQFVISSWTYPDDYGQGIEGIEIYENSTGSWDYVDNVFPDDTGYIEWTAGLFIMLYVYVYMNSTLTGATTTADGLNYIRLNVTVTNLYDTVVYEEDDLDNFYKTAGYDPILWFYGFDTVLNFEPVQGMTYTVTVTYEVYW